jgi:hypothetical protein
MYDDISKLRKAFLDLSTSLDYSRKKEIEVYDTLIRPLEIIINAANDPESEESKIIKIFIDSVFSCMFNIDESVEKCSARKIDKVVTWDQQSNSELVKLNSSYLKAISKYFSPGLFYSETGKQLLDAILHENESRQNDDVKIDINLDWLMYILGKYTKSDTFLSKELSKLPWLNFLLNLKIFFTEELFPQLISLFAHTNNLGTDDPAVLIKFLLRKYKDAMSPNKQLSLLSTFVFDNNRFEISKQTSDRYSVEMQKIYQTKLFFLYGIKENTKQIGRQPESPPYKTLEEIERTFEDNLNYLKSKNLKGDLIMTDEDYLKLKDYVTVMIINEEVPFIESPIKVLSVSDQTIIYSFYKIHQQLFGTKRIRDYFIDFLKAAFSQLHSYDKSTIKTKFSVKPKLFPY